MLSQIEKEDRLQESELLLLSKWLADTAGLHFPRRRWTDLERCMRSATRDLGYRNCRACLHALLNEEERSDEFTTMIRHFTIGETYFFREKAAFRALENVVLPELIKSRWPLNRRLKIWSAACSSGEEPYSIAMLLDQLLAEPEQWHITLLASDINPKALEKAQKGEYRNWSFRGVLEPRHKRYFESLNDDLYRVRDRIQQFVTFAPMNLAEDVYPSLTNNTNALDVVLCRNVLMYFTTEQAQRVVERFHRCLVPGGWLVVSAVEASTELFSDFAPVRMEGVTVYRKPALSNSASFVQDIRSLREPLQPVEPPQEDKEHLPAAVLKMPAVDKAPPPGKDHLEKLYCRGQYREAAALARDLLKEDENPEIMSLLSRTLANQGRLDEARDWAEKAVCRDEFEARHYFLLSAIQRELSDLDEAVASLRRALYLDPDFALAHFALGGLLRRLGRKSESTRAFMAALRILKRYDPKESVPESEGLSAARLGEVIRVMLRG